MEIIHSWHGHRQDGHPAIGKISLFNEDVGSNPTAGNGFFLLRANMGIIASINDIKDPQFGDTAYKLSVTVQSFHVSEGESDGYYFEETCSSYAIAHRKKIQIEDVMIKCDKIVRVGNVSINPRFLETVQIHDVYFIPRGLYGSMYNEEAIIKNLKGPGVWTLKSKKVVEDLNKPEIQSALLKLRMNIDTR